MSQRRKLHLFVLVLLEEGEEQEEALLRGDNAVALLQPFARGCLLLVVHAHIQRLPLEGQPCQIFHLMPSKIVSR